MSAENATMIFRRQMCMLEVRAALLSQSTPLLVCRQHEEPSFAVDRDMALSRLFFVIQAQAGVQRLMIYEGVR